MVAVALLSVEWGSQSGGRRGWKASERQPARCRAKMIVTYHRILECKQGASYVQLMAIVYKV